MKMWSTKTYDKVVATAPVKSNFTDRAGYQGRVEEVRAPSPVQGFDADYPRLFYSDG